MELLTSSLLGLVQGLTEFLPVSSSGHLVLGHALFGAGAHDLAFDALLHLATALAIVMYFRRDIWRIAKGFLTWRAPQQGIALIVATIPAVLAGIFLEDIMATLFRNPLLVAGALTVGSVIMLFAEHVARGLLAIHEGNTVGWRGALLVGFFQSLALVPGMSRSGMTIVGGMFLGLSRAAAARFGFLLGVPILLGAGSKKFLDLYTSGTLAAVGLEVLIGALIACGSGMLVIHYLLAFLRSHTLHVFVVYRLLLATVILLVVGLF